MLEKKLISTELEPETCVLVGLVTGRVTRVLVEEYLDELAFLASTAQAITKRVFIQALDKPDIRTFVGSGKALEIKEYVEEDRKSVV